MSIIKIRIYRMCYAITSQCNQTFEIVLRHSQIEFIDASIFVAVQRHRKPMSTFHQNCMQIL